MNKRDGLCFGRAGMLGEGLSGRGCAGPVSVGPEETGPFHGTFGG